ncbi:MAG: dihydroneopterin aldolase [Verrucomicrobiales bacterium]|nr:dihydroneopterin aldolase [Verrucomicrobiales bacterium]
MPDLIQIADLEVCWRVGVPDDERSRPQRLLLSIGLEVDFAVAVKSDDLTRTINYYAVTQRLQEWGQSREWRLIERLAVEAAELLLREFGPKRVTVEVKKFIIPATRFVLVRVERTQPTATG